MRSGGLAALTRLRCGSSLIGWSRIAGSGSRAWTDSMPMRSPCVRRRPAMARTQPTDNGLPDDGVSALRELVLTRTVAMDRALVWRLWTEPQHLAQWWGPHGFTNPECSIEPRPGGRLRIRMRSLDGQEYLNAGIVQVAEPPERLVFTIALLNPDGSCRLENRITVDLIERGAATEVTVRVQVLQATTDAGENLAGMGGGWSESLARLAEMAASERTAR